MLFHKRTKHIIRYVWIVFSVIIILSMVVTYSGFTMLSSSAPVAATTPPDVSGTAAAEGAPIELQTDTGKPVVVPAAPAAPPLKFDVSSQ